MAINDIYQAQIHYNVGSELTMNVIHLREKTATTEDIPATAVASAIQTKWADFYTSAPFSEEVYVPLIRVRRILPTAGIPVVLILGATAIPGGAAVPPVPSTSALLLSLYTNLFDANGRGRIFVPGLAQDAQNDGQLEAGTLTTLQGLVDDLEADWLPAGALDGEWELVVYSRELDAATKVQQVVVHSNLATQRGRRNFPGTA